jgi:hypothetical protein
MYEWIALEESTLEYVIAYYRCSAENPHSEVLSMLTNKYPDHDIKDVRITGGNLSVSCFDRRLEIYARPLSSDEILGRCLKHFISSLDVVGATHKTTTHHPDECPECKRNIRGWKPVFGDFAPEWWATMRESGIDPSTGHLSSCTNKTYKLK